MPPIRARRPAPLRPAWMCVPRRFCEAVCVGWRMRMPWVMSKRPAALKSWGCEEWVLRFRFGWRGDEEGKRGLNREMFIPGGRRIK